MIRLFRAQRRFSWCWIMMLFCKISAETLLPWVVGWPKKVWGNGNFRTYVSELLLCRYFCQFAALLLVILILARQSKLKFQPLLLNPCLTIFYPFSSCRTFSRSLVYLWIFKTFIFSDCFRNVRDVGASRDSEPFPQILSLHFRFISSSLFYCKLCSQTLYTTILEDCKMWMGKVNFIWSRRVFIPSSQWKVERWEVQLHIHLKVCGTAFVPFTGSKTFPVSFDRFLFHKTRQIPSLMLVTAPVCIAAGAYCPKNSRLSCVFH